MRAPSPFPGASRQTGRPIWPALALGLATLFGPSSSPAQENPAAKVPATSFDPNVKVEVKDDVLVVKSDGIPTHPTGKFPNQTNPNAIRKQNYTFYIPRNPRKAGRTTPTPFGPIGVAVNGVPFYNPYNAEGRDAVMGPNAEIFDSCCGHPDPLGRYHYHKYPVCLKTPFKDSDGTHSPLLGFMFDGFALYGPKGSGGQAPTDLDECNGHDDAERGYHYHVTEKYPYLIGSYRGQPDSRAIDRPRFPGRNGPFVRGGPPPSPLLATLDTDGDGTLSAEEIRASAETLKKLDADGDGTISAEELRPPRPPAPPPES